MITAQCFHDGIAHHPQLGEFGLDQPGHGIPPLVGTVRDLVQVAAQLAKLPQCLGEQLFLDRGPARDWHLCPQQGRAGKTGQAEA